MVAEISQQLLVFSATAGVTVANDKEFIPFEAIRHYSDPVVTVAVGKSMKDLPKFLDAAHTRHPCLFAVMKTKKLEKRFWQEWVNFLEITVYRLQRRTEYQS